MLPASAARGVPGIWLSPLLGGLISPLALVMRSIPIVAIIPARVGSDRLPGNMPGLSARRTCSMRSTVSMA